MDDIFRSMGYSLLMSFGQPVLLTLSDQSTLETQGIITHELVEIGQYEAVSGEITVLSVDSSIKESKPAELPRQLLAELSMNLSAH